MFIVGLNANFAFDVNTFLYVWFLNNYSLRTVYLNVDCYKQIFFKIQPHNICEIMHMYTLHEASTHRSCVKPCTCITYMKLVHTELV